MSSEITAVLVTRDSEMIGVFSKSFQSLGVETENAEDLITVANRWLRAKVEAIVLDFDDFGDQIPIFNELRKNPANRTAIVLAVATGLPTRRVAFNTGAQFILQRPFISAQVDRTIRAAHSLMLQGRRQYFRLSISLDVSISRDKGEILEGKTINISRNGMGVITPSPLRVGESVNVSFLVPASHAALTAQATVVWADKQHQAGLRLEFVNQSAEEHLYAWLDEQCLVWHKVS